METLQTIFWGVAGILKHLSKFLYRNGAILMAGMFVVAVVSFNSREFHAGGRNQLAHVASTQEELSEKQESSEEEESVMHDIALFSGVLQQNIEESQINIDAAIDCATKSMVKSPLSVSEEIVEEADVQTQQEPPKTTETQDTGIQDEKEITQSVTTLAEDKNKIVLGQDDYEALLRIVEAEATGESIEGRMLVANVVLNRVNNDMFPDSVTDVVFDARGGKNQFSPIKDGRYYTVTVSDETKEAVERVLCGEDTSQNALFFAARKYAEPQNMRWFDKHLEYLYTCGGHEFFTLKE